MLQKREHFLRLAKRDKTAGEDHCGLASAGDAVYTLPGRTIHERGFNIVSSKHPITVRALGLELES